MHLPPSADWIGRAAQTRPSAIAVVEGDRSLSYSELDDLVARTVTGLVQVDHVSPGSRVGVVVRRDATTVVLLWAIWRMGAVAVVFDAESPLLAGGHDTISTEWGLAAFAAPQDVAMLEPTAVAEAPAPAAEHTWVPTSGSTGVPRPVILTHGNVAAAVAASQARLGNGPADRWLLALPLSHVGGLSILWRSAAVGGTVVLMDRFDPAFAAHAMRDGYVSMGSVVPTMLHRILDAGEGPYPHMRAVLVGGAAAPSRLIERGLAAGLPVLATYGMTETCAQVTTVDPAEPGFGATTVGYPLEGFEVTIDHPDGNGFGEVLVAGPAVSPGYAFETPRLGPHRTGDIGRIDDNGRLIVAGRMDDMIVTGGENVRPAAVEAALREAPEITEIVVYGLLDDEWGQVVAASAVVAAEDAGAADLDRIASALLPAAHRPRQWRIVPSLPLLPNGKVDRTATAAEHSAE